MNKGGNSFVNPSLAQLRFIHGTETLSPHTHIHTHKKKKKKRTGVGVGEMSG